MGDGVLIYFGYPQAHEDDAERAVRAGLAIIEAIGKLPVQQPLQVRMGVATGLVVVGDSSAPGRPRNAEWWARPPTWLPACRAPPR
jgi:class 3 adenylate cyclase